MLVVWQIAGPTTGASPPSRQLVEIPAVGALEQRGKCNGLESWLMPASTSVQAVFHGDMCHGGNGLPGGQVLRIKEKKRRNSIACQSTELEIYRLIYERDRRKTLCQLPQSELQAEYQSHALLLSMGARKTSDGRRGRLGQASQVGASDADGNGQPLASCPSPLA